MAPQKAAAVMIENYPVEEQNQNQTKPKQNHAMEVRKKLMSELKLMILTE